MPAKLRMAPQKWRTSCGVFETLKIGKDLEFLFPEFSETRTYRVSPDIFELPASAAEPTYDLIIGVETMRKWSAVLDFNQELITIDHQTLPMRDFGSLRDPNELRAQFESFLEPKSTREATNRATEILDANYKKADLHQFVYDECKHLTVLQRNSLYRLLLENEELFDGTLGDWMTDPVKFELKKALSRFTGVLFRFHTSIKPHYGKKWTDWSKLV